MYLQTVCFIECFITPITLVWKLPSLYTLMYLQIICFTECIIKHTTGVCTFHYVKKKKGSSKILTLLALIIACTGVHCGLKYQHWPMKQNLALDQKGCQWHTVPI